MLMKQLFVVMVMNDLAGLIVNVGSRSRWCTFPLDWSQDAREGLHHSSCQMRIIHASNVHIDPNTIGLVASIPSLSVRHEVCQRYNLRNYQGLRLTFGF